MEIEIKFKLKEGVKERVKQMAEFVIKKEEIDIYFNSPIRDFKESDEALRVRKDIEGVKITYKGPKIDKETKSREEISVKVDNFENAIKILKKLGFKPVKEVRKIREIYRTDNAIICIDKVNGLGEYIEIEINHDDINLKEKLFEIAEELGYSRDESIRESYLELLMKYANDKLNTDPEQKSYKSKKLH